MGRARPVGSGFFPLDEELDLLSGSLTPHQQESLVQLCVHLPFEKASAMLTAITGVQVSEPTARRQTYGAGQAYERVQQGQAEQAMSKQRGGRCAGCQPPAPRGKGTPAPKGTGKAQAGDKLVMSSDGAMVPLVGGVWAEAKTRVIGEVEASKEPQEEGVKTGQVSYFSPLSDAQTFGELALVETERRGLTQAKQVAAVQDGALWLEGLVDVHRPDAVRILDFAHAAEYLVAIEQILRSAGVELAAAWLSTQLHA